MGERNSKHVVEDHVVAINIEDEPLNGTPIEVTAYMAPEHASSIITAALALLRELHSLSPRNTCLQNGAVVHHIEYLNEQFVSSGVFTLLRKESRKQNDE